MYLFWSFPIAEMASEHVPYASSSHEELVVVAIQKDAEISKLKKDLKCYKLYCSIIKIEHRFPDELINLLYNIWDIKVSTDVAKSMKAIIGLLCLIHKLLKRKSIGDALEDSDTRNTIHIISGLMEIQENDLKFSCYLHSSSMAIFSSSSILRVR